jgi:DNA-binding response OmpR family regulator
VLIVDGSDDSREVLRTALARRGMRTFEAAQAAYGLELARRLKPDLIVLDLEHSANAESTAGEFATAAGDCPIPIVMLGTVRRDAQHLATGQFLAKPYHYAALILRIEQSLAKTPEPMARGSDRVPQAEGGRGTQVGP